MKRNKKYRSIFYIAHTFSERIFVRDKLIPRLHKLGIETINPFYESDGSWKESRPEVRMADQMAEGGIEPERAAKFIKRVRANYENIVDTDLDLIYKSDGIICYMPEGSTGSTCEIWTCGGVFKWLEKRGYMNHMLEQFMGKPVFLITTSSRLLMHPWIKYACRKVFRSPSAFLKYLKVEMPRLRSELKRRREKIKKHERPRD